MKKLLLILSAAILGSALVSSCKKKDLAPDTTVIEVHDTVGVPYPVHDTVLVVGQDLIGFWTVYKIETVVGSSSSFSNVNYKYNFTTTKLLQDLNLDNVYEYNYNVTYGTSYVDIYYTATPQTHAISTSGKEYRLTTLNGANQTVIYYLRK